MKNKLVILSIALAFIFSSLIVVDAYAQKAAKPLKGEVVSLNDIVMGGKGKVTKDEAKKLAENGNAIVFKSGKKIYFVYNEDGTFASKKLANYAESTSVGIVGKTKTVNGINIIIMSMIDNM